MTEKDHLKGRSWTIDLHTLQGKALLMGKVLISSSAEVLFVAKVITRTNKKLHSPPEGAVAAEGSDYIKSEFSPPEGRLSYLSRYGSKKNATTELHSF